MNYRGGAAVVSGNVRVPAGLLVDLLGFCFPGCSLIASLKTTHPGLKPV